MRESWTNFDNCSSKQMWEWSTTCVPDVAWLAASCRLPSSYQHLPLAILPPAFVLPPSASHHLAACLRPTSICLSLSCRLPSSYQHLPLSILPPASVLPASASRHLAACLRPTSICLSPSCRLPLSFYHLPPPILPPSCHNLPFNRLPDRPHQSCPPAIFLLS